MSEISIRKTLPLQQQQANPEQRIREAAEMYEQYFLNEMVKSMRKTIDHAELTKPSMAEKIYSEQLDQNYVDSWSKRGGIGLADIIQNQLQDRFFNQRGAAPQPKGPIPVEKGTTIKIDETHQPGMPVISPGTTLPANEVSFLYEWESHPGQKPVEVTSPFDGELLQAFRVGDDRQIVKISHDDGMTSTLSFLGQANGLKLGDRITAGQKLGQLAPYAKGLTWQVGQVRA